ncbi:YmfQ family protein [Paraburkholderia adhaesiva]|uniref:YmfQ family protein n=1 Tax=Paraburkholderia adhaesiva TaxID=2883244 RepID=UPI001F30B5C9|nr:putative phage tail protein [Paraburkholderia adhaesiva]
MGTNPDAPVIVPARNSATDYADVLRKLLPRGRVWTREDEGTQAAVLDALAVTAEGIDSEALTLIAAGFPATADQLLPEWDETLGLPDACFGPFANDTENRQQVVAKLISTGGQSIPYFESFALLLGYDIQITEYAVHTVLSPVTAPIAGLDWPFAWKVEIIGTPGVLWHRVDGPVQEALSFLGTTPTEQVLECLLRRYAPAHTVLIFQYS